MNYFRDKLQTVCYTLIVVVVLLVTTASFLRVPIIGKFKFHTDYSLHVASANTKKVLIFILTSPETLSTRGKLVAETWGQRAKEFRKGSLGSPVDVVFSVSEETSAYGLSHLPVVNGNYDDLSNKTFSTFYYLYQHHLNDYEWFMKVDDDTFVKIRKLISYLDNPTMNKSEPLLFGRSGGSWCWGGPGYIINRPMLSLVGPYLPYCLSERRFHGVEDVIFGECIRYAYSQEQPSYEYPDCKDFIEGNGHEFLHVPKGDDLWSRIADSNYTFNTPLSNSSLWSFGKAVTIHTVKDSMMYKLNELYE